MKNVVDHTPWLQYLIECFVAGMKIAPGRRDVSTMLRALRRRRRLWSTFEYSLDATIPCVLSGDGLSHLGNMFYTFDIAPGVFARRDLFSAKIILNPIPSLYHRCDSVFDPLAMTVLDQNLTNHLPLYLDVIIEPAEDLLVALEIE